MNFDNLNFNQQKAVQTINGPVLVIAGTGTDKTHFFTQKIANLVSNHYVNSSKILAITFSNKATEEMKNRLNKLFPDFSFIELILIIFMFKNFKTRNWCFGI